MNEEREVEIAKETIADAGSTHKATSVFDEMTYEQLLDAGRHWRGENFAALVAGILALAAEEAPDILRTALGKVFDTAGIEDTTKRLMLLVNQARDDATEAHRKAHEGAAECRRLLEQVHSEIDGLRVRVQKAQAFMDNLAKRVANAEKHMKVSKPSIFNGGKK